MTALLENETLAGAKELQIATFHVDDALMGITIDQIEEINHHLDLTEVPHAPTCVRGVSNLRGEVVTVVDLRVILGLEPATVTRRTCNVVVRSRGERIGILVDRVGDVVSASWANVEPPPANVAGADGQFFRGVCKLENELLVLLDVEQVLAIDPNAG
jgi:purine-binding chemotaxis protein CheW